MTSFKPLWSALGLWLALTSGGHGACQGRDLIAALPAAERQALETRADLPFAQGNFWTASRAGHSLLLVGTYHLNDPGHDRVEAALAAPLAAASALLVELPPEGEAALKSYLADHPELIFDQTGPSLRDRLPAADWARLAAAIAARGTPAAAILKMRPWLVASMLETPPCMSGDPAALTRGLDRRLMDRAEQQDLPILGLEPYDTALQTFAALSPEDQMEMIRQALLTEAASEDMARTLTAAYLRGQSQLYMEFARAEAIATSGLPIGEIDRQIAVMLESLVWRRNEAWIDKLEAAAAQGPTLAAFGALHLPGQRGVPQLLTDRGWVVTPWTPGQTWPAP